MIDQIERADAVDPSEAMLRVARSLPGADNSKIRWIHAAIEDAPLEPPYGLIVAASSIHWMDLDRTLPRFAGALADGAMLAVLDGDAPVDAPWEREETAFMIDFVAAREGKRPKWWKTVSERFAEPVLVHPGFERSGIGSLRRWRSRRALATTSGVSIRGRPGRKIILGRRRRRSLMLR